MTVVNGTTSRRTSNYAFYFNYTVTNDDVNKRHVVTVNAYLNCISWDFETSVANSWVHINIGGTVYNRAAAGINCNQYAVPHTYLLYGYTAYIPYSTSAQSVYLRAYTDDLYVSGNGPGVCNAATTISIPAKYSTAGTLAAAAVDEEEIGLTLSGLATNVGYTRTLKWYYKKSTDSAYTLAATTTIASNSTASSVTNNIAGLNPGLAYSFKVDVYDGTTLLYTKTVSSNTSAMAGTLAASVIRSQYVYLSLGSLNNAISYGRSCKLYCKKSSATTYTLVSESTIPDGSSEITLFAANLSPATDYDFKADIYRDTVLIGTKTVAAVHTLDLSSGIPKASLVRLAHLPLTTQIRVYWTCYEMETGTTFKITHTPSGGSMVEGSEITAPPSSGYTDINVGTIEADTTFAVTVRSYQTGAEGMQETDPLSVIVYDGFNWDSDKVQGEAFQVTAAEWNRMVDCIIAKYNPTISQANRTLIQANQGSKITNEAFNLIQGYVGITGNSKDDGDPITASELNAIKTAINS